ncbi:hypothetical protein ACEQ8H_006601 [Pleosporales sp. CAS-2024a]
MSAHFNTPPANERDERIAAGLLLLIGFTPNIKDPKNGVTIHPFRPTENYHFETRGPTVIAALSVCMGILTIIAFLRLGIRIFAHEIPFGADDWLIVPAYLLGMAYSALEIAMVVYGGAGKHIYDITYEEYYRYKFLAPTATTVFYVYVGLVKMSIALFNIRLTTLTTRFWKNVNWAFFAACAGYTVAALFLNVFKCRPQYASYNLIRIAESGRVPNCLAVNALMSILRINLALDFTALSIPVIVLWKVQMTWKRKAHIFGVLSIGLVACIASVMTLVSQYTLRHDPLWNYTTLLAWIMVELVVTLLAACLPTLTYLLPRSMFSEHGASKSAASRSTGQNPATGLGSKSSKNQYTLRSRTTNGDERDSEEEERGIIVQDNIRMQRQTKGSSDPHTLHVSNHSVDNGSSQASLYRERTENGGVVVYDDRQREGSTTAWVSTPGIRSSSAHRGYPGQAL